MQHVQPNMVPIPRQPAPEPVFVAAPPKPQRLLHSEAYIKYIESLHLQNRYVSNWDRTLRATVETSAVNDVNRLPVHWFGPGSQITRPNGSQDTVSSIWTLREQMLKDTLNISKLFNL